jgi:hypothetical protein
VDGSQMLDAILADPAKRAALLAVLLDSERFADALDVLDIVGVDGEGNRNRPIEDARAIIARLTEPDRSAQS